jgi:hypothetical protein
MPEIVFGKTTPKNRKFFYKQAQVCGLAQTYAHGLFIFNLFLFICINFSC